MKLILTRTSFRSLKVTGITLLVEFYFAVKTISCRPYETYYFMDRLDLKVFCFIEWVFE